MERPDLSSVGTAGPSGTADGTGQQIAVTAPVRARGPSLRPALVVLGVAFVLVLAFGVGSALTGSSSPSPGRPTTVHGIPLATSPGAGALRPIEVPGTPPADVLGSIVVPAGSSTVSSTPWDGLTQYSGTMRFSLRSSQAAVVAFFRKELLARGWSLLSVGAAHDQPGSTEVLAQRASTDGWYWDIGVVVSPSTFGSGAGAAVETTGFTLELYEVPETTP